MAKCGLSDMISVGIKAALVGVPVGGIVWIAAGEARREGVERRKHELEKERQKSESRRREKAGT